MKKPEFYVGYQPSAPSSYSRARGLFAATVLMLAVVVGLAVAATQKRQPDGTFEFGNVQPFEGTIYRQPLPHLIFNDSIPLGDNAQSNELLLVGFGKRGPGEDVLAAQGRRIRFNGTLIHKDAIGMVEITDPASFETVDGDAVGPSIASEGESVTLTGELVDSKCYLGVMRPGEGKVHRACAVRCLSGGIPPGILVRSEKGAGTVFLLSATDGTPLDFDPQWAARTIRVKGQLHRYGELPIVHVETLALL